MNGILTAVIGYGVFTGGIFAVVLCIIAWQDHVKPWLNTRRIVVKCEGANCVEKRARRSLYCKSCGAYLKVESRPLRVEKLPGYLS